jgi:capsular polysaccharide biosynthesis protein
MSSARPIYGRLTAGARAHAHAPTARERAERVRSLALRARAYWKTAALLFVAVCALAVVAARQIEPSYRSQCTFLVRTPNEAPAAGSGALLAKLRASLVADARLGRIVQEEHIDPALVASHGMAEAIDRMRARVELRRKDDETLLLAYDGASPEDAQAVASRLGDALASESGGSSGVEIRLLDAAVRPRGPARDDRAMAIAIGVALAMFAAFAYAFGRVFFDDTIIDQADVEALTVVPVLGVLPKLAPAHARERSAP